MRGHVLELLKAVFTGQSPDDSILHDVMATIFATILAELAHNSSQVSCNRIKLKRYLKCEIHTSTNIRYDKLYCI